jgi:hypothetical protein
VALGAGDCERLHDGLIAQPVNTASALAYVAVGAWLAGRGLRAGPGRGPLLAFGLAVGLAGVGSVDYHGTGSPAARFLHDGGLYAVAGFVAAGEVARRVRPAQWAHPANPDHPDHRIPRGAWTPWFRAGWTPRRQVAWAPRRRVAYRAALAATAAGAVCWWAGRTASPWCDPDSLLQPHAGWHLLTGAALAAWAWATLMPDETP